jgi:hypothetical protein
LVFEQEELNTLFEWRPYDLCSVLVEFLEICPKLNAHRSQKDEVVRDGFDEVVAVLLPILFDSKSRLHMSIKQKARVLKPLLLYLKSCRKESLPQLLGQWCFILEDLAYFLVSPKYFKYIKQTEWVALRHYFLVNDYTLSKIDHVLIPFQLKKQV